MHIRTINYINLYTKRLFSKALAEYVSYRLSITTIKNKRQLEQEVDNLYEQVIYYCGDLYLKRNEWNEEADYDKFDESVRSIIHANYYRQCNIKNKKDNSEVWISKTLDDIDREIDTYEYNEAS